MLVLGIIFVVRNEVNMAKRRNPKKEKAQRNLAYARKYRKRKNPGGRFFRRQYDRQQTAEQEEPQEDSSVAT